MNADEIIAEAKRRRRQSLFRRWTHYECLKDKLQALNLTPREYERTVRKIAKVLRL
jgi:hypothetical protein